MSEGELLQIEHPWVLSLVVRGPWTPLQLCLLLRALHLETLSSPACLCRYSPYTRRQTPVIKFSRFEASVLFRTSIVKKDEWPEIDRG
jgi:hypothetical protein